MEQKIEKLSELIDESEKILIITHVGPDPDAFSSLILMGTALELNYPDKKIYMNSEEHTGDLSLLKGYEKIHFKTLHQAVKDFEPNLIIMLDAMNFARCTREDTANTLSLVKERNIKLAIIDHHEPITVENNDLYINQESPAAVQDIYEILFNHLKLKKPEGYAFTTMVGLYSDTGGFIYENKRHKATFELVSKLIDDGIKIETIANLIESYDEDIMHTMGELAKNLTHGGDYTFSYVSDDFTNKWVSDNKNYNQLKLGVAHFVNRYIRNVSGRTWGFVIYKDLAAGDDIYGVSLRAISGTKNVANIAKELGGGGHIPAAGAKIRATNVELALKTVQDTIEQIK